MTAEYHAALRLGYINANSPQVANDDVLFIMPTPEQTQHPAWERLLHRPAKRQPKPSLAVVAQEAPAKVAARPTLTRLVVLVYKLR